MVCSHCGYANDASEHRCSRCGRPTQIRLGAFWRRSGLESESPLASLPATGLSEPPPTRQPLWKQELNKKIEGYRDRQKSGEMAGTETAAAEPAASRKAESRTEPASPRLAVAASVGAGLKRLFPQGAPAQSPTPRPKSETFWRRGDSGITPVQPAPADKLPPIVKPATGKPVNGKSLESATTKASGITKAASAAKLPLQLPKEGAAASASAPATAGPQKKAQESSVAAPIAPLAIRAVAGALDFAVMIVATGIFLGVFYLLGGVALTDPEGLRSIAVSFLAIVCFYWIFYVGYLGGTTGMNWLGLRVLNFDGEPPTTAQRRTRALGTILSTLSLGLGFAWSIADEEKLTWHDRMSKTFVTRDGSVGFRMRPSSGISSKRSAELRTASRA